MTDATFTIDEIGIPETLDGPGGADFLAATAVRNVCEVAGYGTPEVAYHADELLPMYRKPDEPKRVFVGRLDGRIVARAVFETQASEAETVWLHVEVLPEARGRGLGTALADLLEHLARDDGRGKAIDYVVSPTAAGETLVPPTGFGAVPRGNDEVRFLLARGWRLEQVERMSRFALPADVAALEEHRAGAAAAAGDAYRVHAWVGGSPERWHDDLALLETRMSTDAPTAGLEEPEEVWTAERWARNEQIEQRAPERMATAAVEHVASGRLAGFTQLRVPDDETRAVGQWDTIVLREHRGHRLGMLLKVENLLQLAALGTAHPSVLTWNAEENRHMLAVNEALGFVPGGYEGAWRKDLRVG
jgi:GNAT superfamily N-acetyltransferase